jgi:hypothetical protein
MVMFSTRPVWGHVGRPPWERHRSGCFCPNYLACAESCGEVLLRQSLLAEGIRFKSAPAGF